MLEIKPNPLIRPDGGKSAQMQIASVTGEVRMIFERPTAWWKFAPDEARIVAEALLDHASRAEGKNKEVQAQKVN